MTFLFISHHLQEVYEVCQDVTVFRDARHVLTAPVGDARHERDLVDGDDRRGTRRWSPTGSGPPRETAPPALTVSGLEIRGVARGHRPDGRSPVRWSGVAGSGSSGKVALAESIVGLQAARPRRR